MCDSDDRSALPHGVSIARRTAFTGGIEVRGWLIKITMGVSARVRAKNVVFAQRMSFNTSLANRVSHEEKRIENVAESTGGCGLVGSCSRKVPGIKVGCYGTQVMVFHRCSRLSTVISAPEASGA